MIKSISHLGFDVNNMEEMLKFYCEGLGMKIKYYITFKDAYEYIRENFGEEKEPEFLAYLKNMGDKKWHVYLEMAENQFLEFFYQYKAKCQMDDLKKYYGYQHFSIQVDDIKETYQTLIDRGITPDTEIRRGPDYTYQFWLTDPDGNSLEMMEYTEKSLQVIGGVENDK